MLLTSDEIHEALENLPGWSLDDKALQRRFRFAKYMDGIRFVEAVASEAEREHHHPDILVRLADVTLFLASHAEGGVTREDLTLAASVSAMAPRFGAHES